MRIFGASEHEWIMTFYIFWEWWSLTLTHIFQRGRYTTNQMRIFGFKSCANRTRQGLNHLGMVHVTSATVAVHTKTLVRPDAHPYVHEMTCLLRTYLQVWEQLRNMTTTCKWALHTGGVPNTGWTWGTARAAATAVLDMALLRAPMAYTRKCCEKWCDLGDRCHVDPKPCQSHESFAMYNEPNASCNMLQ